jgi:cell wall-associated NlpC family hydrolase
LKEEQFLRHLFATGVLAFMLAGSTAFASADPTANSVPLTTATVSAPTVTAPATVSRSEAASASEASEGPGTPVESPDVAEWTAQLIHDQQKNRIEKERRTASAPVLGKFATRIFSRTTTIAKSLTRDALRFLGTPYVFGGTSTSGFDCSGFVQHVFAMLGMSIPRTADAQYYAGSRAKGGVKIGDLVFFQTYAPGPSHVGIYLGHGRFVHASSHGVMVSSLSNSYWASRYLGAKRFIARQ